MLVVVCEVVEERPPPPNRAVERWVHMIARVVSCRCLSCRVPVWVRVRGCLSIGSSASCGSERSMSCHMFDSIDIFLGQSRSHTEWCGNNVLRALCRGLPTEADESNVQLINRTSGAVYHRLRGLRWLPHSADTGWLKNGSKPPPACRGTSMPPRNSVPCGALCYSCLQLS